MYGSSIAISSENSRENNSSVKVADNKIFVAYSDNNSNGYVYACLITIDENNKLTSRNRNKTNFNTTCINTFIISAVNK